MRPPLAPRLALPLGLLLLAALPACSSSEPDAQRASLEGARARWASATVANYRLTYHRACFCPSVRTTVVVRGGAVDSVYAGPEGEEAAVDYDPQQHWDVPALFDFVEAALDRDPAEAQVDYDVELGYPRSAGFDYSRDVIDEEDGFVVLAFSRL